jgi:hypothetical protein
MEVVSFFRGRCVVMGVCHSTYIFVSYHLSIIRLVFSNILIFDIISIVFMNREIITFRFVPLNECLSIFLTFGLLMKLLKMYHVMQKLM